MKRLKVSVSVFELILVRVFDRFFTELTADPYHADFLKEADFKRLKEAQRINFIESVGDDKDAFFLRYKSLGRFHFEKGLSYVEYYDAFNMLRTLLTEEAEESDGIGDAKMIREAIETYIKKAINASAAGYLEETLGNDRITLLRQIGRQFDIVAIKEHLQWVLDVTDDISQMNARPSVKFDEEKCNCGRWLNSSEFEKFFEDPLVRQEIMQKHHDIHMVTRNIYRSIEREDYHKIFIDYINMVRQSMYLYQELNFNVTQQSMIEDVSKDALTGLLNRRYLNEVLKSEVHLHALSGGAFTVVMFDLDHFKAVNDTCGHQGGDDVIVTFAGLLKRHLRKTDNIFRYGGEEFLVILPGTAAEEAFAVCEKIRSDFEKQTWSGCLENMPITVSIGISQYTDALKENPRRVIFDADKNLYRAKVLGRNRTVK
ncbi:diguanylate cyclase [Sulfurimonas sp. HSL3-7]|uniref:diguanylate cyclase n=1 Tax=Sulfonitrofixus jiaomeiensis TaxID=3131938 RepID=UPI0031FA47C0